MQDIIYTTDNSSIEVKESNRNCLAPLSGSTIKQLGDKHPNLIVFPPPNTVDYGDKLQDESIFHIDGNNLITNNVMGFIGYQGTRLCIRSRFTKDKSEHGNDYFLHYMLSKVLSIHLFDLKTGVKQDDVWDFLIYLFPYYLRRAMRQGLFKQYKKFHYNDARFRSGTIDVSRHITANPLFNGNIAYSKREFSVDNALTQLIRHTIEYINAHRYVSKSLLHCDTEIKDFVYQITNATPTYNRRHRQNILMQNLKMVKHPYFTEYNTLQKICVQILHHEKISYGENQNEIYGVLFDGAWLWEEYLNTILSKHGFIHPENKKDKGALYLFEGSRKYPRYPDFYRRDESSFIVLDAKYKRHENNNDTIVRDDIHQLISYMYILQATMGGFVYPVSSTHTPYNLVGKLKGYEGSIVKLLFGIPAESTDFSQFIHDMEKQEKFFWDSVKCKCIA